MVRIYLFFFVIARDVYLAHTLNWHFTKINIGGNEKLLNVNTLNSFQNLREKPKKKHLERQREKTGKPKNNHTIKQNGLLRLTHMVHTESEKYRERETVAEK